MEANNPRREAAFTFTGRVSSNAVNRQMRVAAKANSMVGLKRMKANARATAETISVRNRSATFTYSVIVGLSGLFQQD